MESKQWENYCRNIYDEFRLFPSSKLRALFRLPSFKRYYLLYSIIIFLIILLCFYLFLFYIKMALHLLIAKFIININNQDIKIFINSYGTLMVTIVLVFYTARYVKITNSILKETSLSRKIQLRPEFLIEFKKARAYNTKGNAEEFTDKLNLKMEFTIYNYSNSIAIKPRLIFRYLNGHQIGNYEIAESTINLNNNYKIMPHEEINTEGYIYSFLGEKMENIQQPFIHMQFFYEDIERNLYAHSILYNLSKNEYTKEKIYYLYKNYEGIFVNSNGRYMDNDSSNQIFPYRTSEKIFSRRKFYI